MNNKVDKIIIGVIIALFFANFKNYVTFALDKQTDGTPFDSSWQDTVIFFCRLNKQN